MSGARLPDGFIDEIKARIRLSDYIGRRVKLKKQGRSWVGLSPFSNEKTPSFYVHDEEGFFKCFSTQTGGDLIKWVQETERLGFMEAVEKLAEEAGMQIPQASPEAREVHDRRQRLQGAAEAACAFFEDRLRSGDGAPARTYLEGRGLSPEAWARHRLGFAPDDWRQTIDHLKGAGFRADELVEAGLAVRKEGGGEPYDRFRGRVIFPILDRRGGVIAFGGRALEPDAKPKYLNSSDSPLFHKSQVLYRYKAAREALADTDARGLIVCEGYMDAIALAEAGFGHAVAPLGTALTEDQLALIWQAAPEPILCFDGDVAGRRAAYRSIDRALPFLGPDRQLFFTLLPEGLDPDDLIRQQGAGAMRHALDVALPLVEVLWQRERDAEPLDTPERQAGLEARLKAASDTIQHPGVKSAYEQALRQKARNWFWELRQTARNRDFQARSTAGNTLKSGPTLSVAPPEIKGLHALIYVMEDNSLLDIGWEELALARFPNPDVCAIRDAILDLADGESEVDQARVCAHLVNTGNTRAAELLDTYLRYPRPDRTAPEAQEWLTALEQYAATNDPDVADLDSSDAFGTVEDAKRRHRRVAEMQARKMRLRE